MLLKNAKYVNFHEITFLTFNDERTLTTMILYFNESKRIWIGRWQRGKHILGFTLKTVSRPNKSS